MKNLADLGRTLERLDGRGYKAYKEIGGDYGEEDLRLFIDHVQGDPFAAPSKIRVRLPQTLPPALFANRVRSVALEDYLARQVRHQIGRLGGRRRGSGKSGLVTIDAGGQEVLERTAVAIATEWVEARLQVGLPAAGRRVLGGEAVALLCRQVPVLGRSTLLAGSLDLVDAGTFVECVENQEAIRRRLDEMGLVAFVADGAVLPRQSGVSDRPMNARQAVPFRAPESLRVEIAVPNPTARGDSRICGMGIPAGVTLIVGGGFHGKSTLLRAVERGVYAHVPGDGREYVVASNDAVKIRAEDGRRIERVDVSPFIGDLPFGRSTADFSTEDASGSTSQAANIVEALEVGARVLLIDEDTSATNFMVRDARMQHLVSKDHEPITPFLDRVRELYDKLRVSTVLVTGGSGDYLEVADTVILMREYLPQDVTAQAQRVAREHPSGRRLEVGRPLKMGRRRAPVAASVDPSRGKRSVKIDARSLDRLLFGRQLIELGAVEQLVDLSQTRAVGYALELARHRFMDSQACLAEVVAALEELLDTDGLDVLDPFRREGRHPGNFARPRRHEVAAALNRLRSLRIR